MKKDITIDALKAIVSTSMLNREVTVELEDVEVRQVLECFTSGEIAAEMNVDGVLQELTAQQVVSCFNDNAALLDEIDGEALAEHLTADFCAGIFETSDLVKHMDKSEILACFSVDELQQHIDLNA